MPLTQIPTGMFEDNSVTSAKLSSDLRNQAPAFKNRIINGAMVIDQRNAGASVSATSGGVFTVDRWDITEDTDGTMTAQQSSVAPAGFSNSLLITTTSADTSLSTSQYAMFSQRIEGFNISDLAWGTASAQPVTLSFWVRSSLTGTFAGSLRNSAANRSYPFTYAIAAANTWEQKTITIPGDTAGTWLTNNGIGIRLTFGLGAGASLTGTADAWASANVISATGAVSVIGTNSATWQITGVQLEKGSTATSFDYRPYGTELQLCQRYYESDVGGFSFVLVTNVTGVFPSHGFAVTKRAAPTMTVTPGSGSGATLKGSAMGFYQNVNNSANSECSWTASAEL